MTLTCGNSLAYLAPPLLLEILDRTSPTTSLEHQDPKGCKAIYCAQVIQNCKSRFEGVEDLTNFIKGVLSTVSLKDISCPAQAPSFSSSQSPIGWERLLLCKPHLYLRLVLSLNHAMACGELPEKSQLLFTAQENGRDESSAPRDTREGSATGTMSFKDDVCESASLDNSPRVDTAEESAGTVQSTCPSSNAWTLDDVAGGDESPVESFQDSAVDMEFAFESIAGVSISDLDATWSIDSEDWFKVI